MRKLSFLTLFVLGISGIASGAAFDAFYPVTLNGHPFGQAILINGQPAIALIDFCKLGGGTVTLEDVGLTLTGNTLKISSQVFDAYHKHKVDTTQKVNVGDPAAVKIDTPAYKPQTPYKEDSAYKWHENAMWKWQRDGVIANTVLRTPGGIYIPVSDLARAFGGTFTMPANGLKPGATIQLNFTKTPNAILVGL